MNDIVKLVTGAPAAAVKVPPYKAFDKFTESAKSAVEIYKDIGKALKGLYEHCPAANLERGKKLLDDYERYDCKIIRRCERDKVKFESDDAYNDQDEITRGQVSKHIALLIGSFPNANPADPETYTKMLIEEVVAASPMVTTLEAACRKIRRSAKFLPTISEVLTAIEDEGKAWDERWDAINFTDDLADDLRQRLATETERRAVEADERLLKAKERNGPVAGGRVTHVKFGAGTVLEVDGNRCRVSFDKAGEKLVVADFLERIPNNDLREEKSPIVVGDRVRSSNAGVGTVIAIEKISWSPGDVQNYRVRFDVIYAGKNEYNCGVQYLERLIPGDEGFEPPAVPMLEHSKDVPMAPINLTATPLDQIAVGKKDE